MRRIVATILIALLVHHPRLDGSRRRASRSSGRSTRSLEAGTEIVLTVAGGEPTKCACCSADDANIITLKPTTALPGRVAKFLLSTGTEWPAVLSGSATTTDAPSGRRRMGSSTVIRSWCALADAVQQTARGDVKENRKASRPRWAYWMAVLGGILLVVAIGAALAAAGD